MDEKKYYICSNCKKEVSKKSVMLFLKDLKLCPQCYIKEASDG